VVKTIELKAGPARVVLAPEVGGAVASFDWRGQPLLRPTSAAALALGTVRLFASYPLIPFSNRIANAVLRWNGSTYPLPRYMGNEPHAIHGNGWQRAWSVIASTPQRALLELNHDALGEHAGEWPFPYRARQTLELAPEQLTLTLEIINTGATAFPFGLGWHPFFPRNSATELQFSARGMWRTDATMMPIRLEPIAQPFDFHAPRAIAGTVLDNCFAEWQPPASLRWPDRGLCAEISADEACGHLVVYVPQGKEFMAIEPVTHMTDAFHRAAAGARGTGTRLLAPDEAFSCTMRISAGKTR